DLFPPLALRAFGQGWFEGGSLSLYFRNATLDREPVRALIKQPPAGASDSQVEAWIDRDDGMRVAEGSLAVGDAGEPTALQRIPLEDIDCSGLRILAGVAAGDEIPELGVIYSSAQHAERMAVITEKLSWHEGDSPWGGPIITPAGMVTLLYAQPVASLRKKLGDAVGLFGAIEISNLDGPALVDVPYRVGGRVLAAGQSPKTEFFWFETTASDAGGRPVAAMRMLLRFMKASSPLYAA
ncbi:MAG: hypothetical protein ACR2NO_05430, partial [Chloroflexota bacterium]